jgi:hypothetical protein
MVPARNDVEGDQQGAGRSRHRPSSLGVGQGFCPEWPGMFVSPRIPGFSAEHPRIERESRLVRCFRATAVPYVLLSTRFHVLSDTL